MKHTPYPTNFIYPNNITEKTYIFGGGQINDPIIKDDGDWRDKVPEAEDQNKFGVESSACYVEAQQHTVASIQEEVFKLIVNYSSRFNALLSNGTPHGGNPIDAAESMRKDGMITEDKMPFDKNIESWEDFHSWKGVSEYVCRKLGKEFTDNWELKYHVVFQKNDSLESKYQKLKEALKRSPVALRVYAWVEIDGEYVKPEGYDDTHLTMAVFCSEDNKVTVWDTYVPYMKICRSNTNFDFAIQWSVKKKQPRRTFWQFIINLFK